MNSSVKMNFITDTGASISLAGMGFARLLGVREDDLLQTSMSLTGADNTSIKVLGVVVVELHQGVYLYMQRSKGLFVKFRRLC